MMINIKIRIVLLLIYGCFYITGIAQKTVIPLAEINFRKGDIFI